MVSTGLDGIPMVSTQSNTRVTLSTGMETKGANHHNSLKTANHQPSCPYCEGLQGYLQVRCTEKKHGEPRTPEELQQGL